MEIARLRWPQLVTASRVGWLGLLVAVVLVLLMCLLFWRLGNDINTYQAELAGAQRIKTLYVAVNALQRHRDASVAVLAGDAAQENARRQAMADVTLALQHVANQLPVGIRASRHWARAQADWQEILGDGLEWTWVENFRRHTDLIGVLFTVMVDVADDSQLTLDVHLDSYYLQDMLVNRLPMVQEYLSRLRGLGVTAIAAPGLSDSVKRLIRTTMVELSPRLTLQQDGVERLRGVLPEQARAIDDAQAQLVDGVNAMLDILNQEVLIDKIVTTPLAYATAVTRQIDSSYQLADTIYQPALTERLEAHIRSARLLAISVAMGVLVAVLSLIRIVRQVLARDAALTETNTRLAEENRRRQQTEESLRLAMDATALASRAKSEFLANLSHEVRTPLNGILGMAELLAMGEVSEEQRPLLMEISASGNALKHMLNRIIDFTHLEAGSVTFACAPFVVDESLNALIYRHRDAAQRKGLQLNVEIAPEVPTALLGDGHHLQQTIDCLVDNAVKFTDSGTITVRADAGDSRCTEGWFPLRVTVIDTGNGIPAEMHAYIFESFTQVDGSATRRFGGNGLGLAIARRLAIGMQGKLELAESSSKGSVFALSLCLERFPEEPEP